MIRRLVVLVAGLVLVGCASRMPAPASTDRLGEAVTAEHLTGVLSRGGLSARTFDATSLIVTDGPVGVVIFVEDAGASLQGVMACPGCTGSIAPGFLQEWNSSRRFGRAYRDEDGLPVLAADLPLDPTISEHTVVEWARLLLAMGAAFQAEVWPQAR